MEGGPAAALVNETDDGIRLVLAMVYGSTVEQHAFILSSGIMKEPYVKHHAAIVDNRKKARSLKAKLASLESGECS